jgi:hypothetical protein
VVKPFGRKMKSAPGGENLARGIWRWVEAATLRLLARWLKNASISYSLPCCLCNIGGKFVRPIRIVMVSQNLVDLIHEPQFRIWFEFELIFHDIKQ